MFHKKTDKPVRGYPYYEESSLIFAFENVDYEEETGEWGAAVLNLETGTIERYTSPFQVNGEDVYPEDISWSLYGKVNDFFVFVFVFSWETSYEKASQFVKWDRVHWYLLEKPDSSPLCISSDSSFVRLEDVAIINQREFCVSGGGIHPYQINGVLHFALDCSHAFEHDNSPTVVNNSYEQIKKNYPAYYSNLELIDLRIYKRTKELPESIPVDHIARDEKYVWDMKIAEHEDMFFIFHDSYRERGILDILILKNELNV